MIVVAIASDNEEHRADAVRDIEHALNYIFIRYRIEKINNAEGIIVLERIEKDD